MWRLLFATLLFSAVHSTDLSAPFDKSLHDAAEEVISSSFESAVTINFVVSLVDETKRNQHGLINSLAQRCKVVYIEDVQAISPSQKVLHNVIFIEDFASFLRFSSRLSSDNFVIHGYYLFVFVEGKIREIDEIAKRLWTLFIYNVGFLMTVEDGTSVLLMTFFPFSKANCNSTQAVVVRNFSEKALNWREPYFPEKISDLEQCPVKIVTFNCPPMMMIKYENDGFDLTGPDGEMLKSLSALLNFKIDLLHISDLIRWLTKARKLNHQETSFCHLFSDGVSSNFECAIYTTVSSSAIFRCVERKRKRFRCYENGDWRRSWPHFRDVYDNLSAIKVHDKLRNVLLSAFYCNSSAR